MNQTQPSASRELQTREVIAVCLGLVLAVAIVFGQTVGFGYLDYDDQVYVRDNPVVKKGLTLDGFFWSWRYGEIGHWHPLTWLSHMADCNVYGGWVGGYHLTNVILHAAAAVLLFLSLREMTGKLWRSAGVAALFAIHPLRAESVAWIAERKDVLSGMFCMLTLWFYARYVRKPSGGRYVFVVLALAMGLLSKNMLVTVPFVLLLLDWWPLQRAETPRARLILEKVPLFFLAAGSCVATALVPEKIGDAARVPLQERLANAVVSCAIYVREMIFPVRLSAMYIYPPHGFPWWEIGLSFLLLAAISAAAAVYRKKHPWLMVGWLWYLGMLLPVCGIIQISYYARADRYTYLPGIGLLLAGTWVVAEWIAGWHRQARAAFISAVLLVLMACAWKQTSYWKTSESLWSHALACDNNDYVAQYSMADALVEDGRLDEAFPHFQQAIALAPRIYDNHFGYARALRKKGKLDDAIAQYEEAARLAPSRGDVHNDLGTALREQGRVDDAIRQFQLALQWMPRNDAVHFNLAKAFYQRGSLDQAIIQYKAVLEINPSDVESQNNLAWLLATARPASWRDGGTALQLARQANGQSGGRNPVILGTLAAALAETGQFSDAIQTVNHAIALARDAGQPALARQLDEELRSYQAGHPFRQ